jgi:hypothetical protein
MRAGVRLMLKTALEGEQPVLFSDLDPPVCCPFCGRERPRELVNQWMCHSCKQKSIFELFWKLPPAANHVVSGRKGNF